MAIDLDLTAGLDTTLWDKEGAEIRRSVLPGGVRLLTERDPNVRSVSVGMWLPVGSRDETPQHAGSTHFLEHLLFKGTSTRSALDIAHAFDEVGGESNAVTAKEHTCYYARVRSVDLPMAIEILADMVISASITDEAFQTEREVILEELAMAEDDPTDVGHETLMAQVLGPESALGRPVGGTPETIKAVHADAVREHYEEHYVPSNLVVTVVGHMHHEEVERLLLEALERGGWSLAEGAAPQARRPVRFFDDSGWNPSALDTLRTAAPAKHLVRPTEQTHLFLGGPSLTVTDSRRHAQSVLLSIVGGGMSSRMFQEIREKRGLAYSVYAFSGAYRDAGLTGMYAACRPQHAETVASLMIDEVEKLAEHGVTDAELRRTLGHIAGSMALGLEDTQSRMARLATAELTQGVYRSVDESLAQFEAVRVEDVQEVARLIAHHLEVRVDVGPRAES